MENSKIKTTLLITLFVISQLIGKAQPGVLDIVFKSKAGNTQENITIKNQRTDILNISIFDSKNKIVYNGKYALARQHKIFCKLPENIYTVVIAKVNGYSRPQIYKINLD